MWKKGMGIPDLFVKLFADCKPVRGAKQSAIYDLSRHEIIAYPTEYHSAVLALDGKRLSEFFLSSDTKLDKEALEGLVEFLFENELVMFTERPEDFPDIEDTWDYPGSIQNAVIDIDKHLHDFTKIFNELDALGCQHIQIRCFSHLLTLDICAVILKSARDKTIAGVEMILKFEDGISDLAYVNVMRSNPILTSLIIHSAPTSRIVSVIDHPSRNYDSSPLVELRITSEQLYSEHCCGNISISQLTPPTMNAFFEAQSHNGCLNQKIAVSASGEIKNCPSLPESLGNICDVSLLDALKSADLRKRWHVIKDNVAICKDCEYRYACSDCRAYLEIPTNDLSKPLKCGYDPYSGVWSEWSDDPFKRETASLYHIKI